MAPMEQPDTACRLLALPAELRNNIWRLVLRKENSITVNADGYPREGLMNTCHRVRNETLKIFYYENRFGLSTARYDPSNAVQWYNLVKELGLEIDMRTIEDRRNVPDQERVTWWDLRRYGMDRRPHWGNLLKWMEFVHAGKALGNLTSPMEYYANSKTSRRSLLIKGLFATVDDLKALPWCIVEKVVCNQRPALAGLDNRWMIDEELSERLQNLASTKEPESDSSSIESTTPLM